MRVKIGLTQAPRELDLDVDDADEVVADLEKAIGNGGGIHWITESSGRRYGVVVSKVAFIDVEPSKPRSGGIGFGKD